ncbi:MAG: tetratricopeptide repeat protein [Planctomycetes bacterium]|nr:tetratricopeptide repeat protein [Planctomycetota bacterium]
MTRIDSIRKLLAASPDDTFLLYSLGMELMTAGRAVEAAEAFERVLRIDPDYLAAYGQLGRALEAAGDRDAAVERYRAGLAVAQRQGDHHAADRFRLWLAAAGGGA